MLLFVSVIQTVSVLAANFTGWETYLVLFSAARKKKHPVPVLNATWLLPKVPGTVFSSDAVKQFTESLQFASYIEEAHCSWYCSKPLSLVLVEETLWVPGAVLSSLVETHNVPSRVLNATWLPYEVPGTILSNGTVTDSCIGVWLKHSSTVFMKQQSLELISSLIPSTKFLILSLILEQNN